MTIYNLTHIEECQNGLIHTLKMFVHKSDNRFILLQDMLEYTIRHNQILSKDPLYITQLDQEFHNWFKQIRPITHTGSIMQINDAYSVMTFATSHEYTITSNNLVMKNIRINLDNPIRYLNELVVIENDVLRNYVAIDNRFDSIPKSIRALYDFHQVSSFFLDSFNHAYKQTNFDAAWGMIERFAKAPAPDYLTSIWWKIDTIPVNPFRMAGEHVNNLNILEQRGILKKDLNFFDICIKNKKNIKGQPLLNPLTQIR